jgi:hypothetical protein
VSGVDFSRVSVYLWVKAGDDDLAVEVKESLLVIVFSCFASSSNFPTSFFIAGEELSFEAKVEAGRYRSDISDPITGAGLFSLFAVIPGIATPPDPKIG